MERGTRFETRPDLCFLFQTLLNRSVWAVCWRLLAHGPWQFVLTSVQEINVDTHWHTHMHTYAHICIHTHSQVEYPQFLEIMTVTLQRLAEEQAEDNGSSQVPASTGI